MKYYLALVGILLLFIAAGCGNSLEAPRGEFSQSTVLIVLNEKTTAENASNKDPAEWGEKVTGIKTRLDTANKVMALTFDACGGSAGSRYDRKLLEYLMAEKIPATLFINSRWIDANSDVFISLADNSLFEIANHGTQHKPLSVNGKSAYGLKGTGSMAEVREEVLTNEQKILKLTGCKPKFFRPGTAFADEVAVAAVRDLGEEVVGFNVLGDAGATFNRKQVKAACLQAAPGSIIIFHMNHPESETLAGLREVIPELRRRGWRFVKLSDYPLK